MWTVTHQEHCVNPATVTSTWTNSCRVVKMPVLSSGGGGHVGTETSSGRTGMMPLGDTHNPLFTPVNSKCSLLLMSNWSSYCVHSLFWQLEFVSQTLPGIVCIQQWIAQLYPSNSYIYTVTRWDRRNTQIYLSISIYTHNVYFVYKALHLSLVSRL